MSLKLEWRSIAGQPNYQVSNTGLVRSIRRKEPFVMAQEADRDGYKKVQLSNCGTSTHYAVHRLVAMAFLGEPPSFNMVVCHGDGSRDNNLSTNLRWGTQAENVSDKVVHGTHQIGSKHPRSSIDEVAATCVKTLLSEGTSLRKTAALTGTSFWIVADISRGRTWNHVNI